MKKLAKPASKSTKLLKAYISENQNACNTVANCS